MSKSTKNKDEKNNKDIKDIKYKENEKRDNVRTDLAVENHEYLNKKYGHGPDGVDVDTYEDEKMTVTSVYILNEKGSMKMKKPIGSYITIECRELRNNDVYYKKKVTEALADSLKTLLKDYKDPKVLVVGLGNWNVTPDALGPKAAEKILVTRHIKDTLPDEMKGKVGNVSAVSPGVLGITGIETGEIIRGIVERAKPDVVIAIDALAARSVSRINSAIQISDTGINPGAGVGNGRMPLNNETLGIPVIAIGVPTVVDAATLVNDTLDSILEDMIKSTKKGELFYQTLSQLCEEEKYDAICDAMSPYSGNMFVTPKEVDAVIDRLSVVIADAVNIVLNPAIDIDNINSFIV
ncbi:MAG: GPR endopeptidase [Clostridia bacterium]|jgi:spore protease|nr:GPR endopeptidase [Clostridia bacterium]